MEHDHRPPLTARILIVDDTEANVFLMDSILRSEGFSKTWTTCDPREVKPLHEKLTFDLIILDLNMPHMNGFQVMQALADDIRSGALQVLVMTAYSDWQTRPRVMELGAGGFITLPFERADVLAHVHALLGRAKAARTDKRSR